MSSKWSIVYEALLILALASACQMASGQVVVAVADGPVPIAQMLDGRLYYTDKNLDFSDWTGPEKNVLNLFPGFRDNNSQASADGKYADVEIVIARNAIILDKPVSAIDLNVLKNESVIQDVQSDLADISPLNPAEVKTTHPGFTYRSPSGGWCSSPGSLCLHSEFKIDPAYSAGIALQVSMENMKNLQAPTLDGDIESQSELRVLSGAEIPDARDVMRLTGIAAQPSAMIELNSFWYNHFLEFSKLVAVVQPHPTDPSKSVLTGYAVFAVEMKHWNDPIVPLRDMLMGRALNSSTGLTSGIPKVTQSIFAKIATRL